jgi:hypothetical protein
MGSQQGVCDSNTNNGKIKQDQWGGTCITAASCLSSFVTEVGCDTSGLGRWTWLYVGGGGKTTQMIVAHQPCTLGRRTTKGETVWDQHHWCFEAPGEIRHPRAMFKSDLLSLLCRWKAAGDEILLMGNFNENIYTGNFAIALAGDKFQMSEMCSWTTGILLPPTHARGSTPIDAVYGTAGLFCSSVALLPGRVGVGDHQVFIVDILSKSILGNAFPRVIPIARRLLTYSSDKIRNNYTPVLNQLANRHLIFKKLLLINQDNDHAELHLRLNLVDLELEKFMKSAEQGCHKYKRNNIEWFLYAGMWILRRWLLSWVLTFMSGRTMDPRNLFCDCRLKSVKDP